MNYFTNIFNVLVKVGKALVVFMLVVMLGAQWALLQSVAWTTMLADNLRTHSLSESLVRTFDGQHPCPICQSIAAAKKSERSNSVVLQLQKLEFPPVALDFVLTAPARFQPSFVSNTFAVSFLQKPPTPPPRSSLV